MTKTHRGCRAGKALKTSHPKQVAAKRTQRVLAALPAYLDSQSRPVDFDAVATDSSTTTPGDPLEMRRAAAGMDIAATNTEGSTGGRIRILDDDVGTTDTEADIASSNIGSSTVETRQPAAGSDSITGNQDNGTGGSAADFFLRAADKADDEIRRLKAKLKNYETTKSNLRAAEARSRGFVAENIKLKAQLEAMKQEEGDNNA